MLYVSVMWTPLLLLTTVDWSRTRHVTQCNPIRLLLQGCLKLEWRGETRTSLMVKLWPMRHKGYQKLWPPLGRKLNWMHKANTRGRGQRGESIPGGAFKSLSSVTPESRCLRILPPDSPFRLSRIKHLYTKSKEVWFGGSNSSARAHFPAGAQGHLLAQILSLTKWERAAQSHQTLPSHFMWFTHIFSLNLTTACGKWVFCCVTFWDDTCT